MRVYERLEQNLIEGEKGEYNKIKSVLPLIAKAAQEEYDAWEQDDEGISDIYGGGGICDEISNKIMEILSEIGFDVEIGGQDGDDHSWVLAEKDGRIYGIDIDPSIYEEGRGYSWKKKEDVIFTEDDISIWEEDYQQREGNRI